VAPLQIVVFALPVKLGLALIVIDFVILSDPKEFVAFSLTEYVPGELKVNMAFCKIEVDGLLPLQVHKKDVGLFVDVLVAVIALPWQAVGDMLKFADGLIPVARLVIVPVK
jgi:hypothetical protein